MMHGRQPQRIETGFWRNASVTATLIVALCFLATPPIYIHLGIRASDVIHSLRTAKLSRIDVDKLQRGYYEELLNVDRLDSELWEVQATKPRGWGGLRSAARRRRDFLEFELVPSSAVIFKGAPFHVNQWGFRDREYARTKPPSTYRAALLGASDVLGGGVADGETFESLLEERLNRDRLTPPVRRYEILNFAMSRYGPLQRMLALETKVLAFDPDAVFYVAHAPEIKTTIGHLWIYLPTLLEREGGWVASRAAALAKRSGFELIDLSTVYDGYDRSDLRLTEWDFHLNRLGHRVVAERLYVELRKLDGDIPFSRSKDLRTSGIDWGP